MSGRNKLSVVRCWLAEVIYLKMISIKAKDMI